MVHVVLAWMMFAYLCVFRYNPKYRFVSCGCSVWRISFPRCPTTASNCISCSRSRAYRGHCLDWIVLYVGVTQRCRVMTGNHNGMTAPSACTHGSFDRRRERKCNHQFVQNSPKGNITIAHGVLDVIALHAHCIGSAACAVWRKDSDGWMHAYSPSANKNMFVRRRIAASTAPMPRKPWPQILKTHMATPSNALHSTKQAQLAVRKLF